MQMSVANTLSYILVVAAIINFEESLTMSQPSVFNARPARRIIGYQCKNPNCLKVFPNVFAYNMHRNHATTRGTMCASLMMRDEISGLRRSDTSTAALSTRASTGWTLSAFAPQLNTVVQRKTAHALPTSRFGKGVLNTSKHV